MKRNKALLNNTRALCVAVSKELSNPISYLISYLIQCYIVQYVILSSKSDTITQHDMT